VQRSVEVYQDPNYKNLQNPGWVCVVSVLVRVTLGQVFPFLPFTIIHCLNFILMPSTLRIALALDSFVQ